METKISENFLTKVLDIRDEEDNVMESCPHPKQKIYVKFDKDICINDLIRIKED